MTEVAFPLLVRSSNPQVTQLIEPSGNSFEFEFQE